MAKYRDIPVNSTRIFENNAQEHDISSFRKKLMEIADRFEDGTHKHGTVQMIAGNGDTNNLTQTVLNVYLTGDGVCHAHWVEVVSEIKDHKDFLIGYDNLMDEFSFMFEMENDDVTGKATCEVGYGRHIDGNDEPIRFVE